MIVPVDVARLIAQARAVPIECELARRGIRLNGRVDRCGPCPVCGGSDRFSINVNKQVWNCRGCAVGGDVIALVQHLDRTGFVPALQILSDAHVSSPAAATAAPAGRVAAKERAHEQHRKAAWLWSKRQPLAGSIAETYLRKARAIAGPLPPTLAFLPPTRPAHHPALIAAYGIPQEPEPGLLTEPRTVGAVHLTLLKPDGSGKAGVKCTKIGVGSHAGVPVVLAPPNDLLGLAIAEGVEDALSVHAATGLGAWAAGGAALMPALAPSVPSYVECVTVVVDDDAAGHRNTVDLAARLSRRGIQVEFWGMTRNANRP